MRPVIDYGALKHLENDDDSRIGPSLVEAMIALYLCTTPERLKELERYAGERDAYSFRRVAHSLKSASALLGLKQMETLCLGLEVLARAGDLSTADPVLEGVRRHYAGLKPILEAYRAEKARPAGGGGAKTLS